MVCIRFRIQHNNTFYLQNFALLFSHKKFNNSLWVKSLKEKFEFEQNMNISPWKTIPRLGIKREVNEKYYILNWRNRHIFITTYLSLGIQFIVWGYAIHSQTHFKIFVFFSFFHTKEIFSMRLLYSNTLVHSSVFTS